MNKPIYDFLSWFLVAVVSTLAIVLLRNHIELPATIARILIGAITVVVVVLLISGKQWSAAVGFILGFAPLILLVFTPLGTPIATALLRMLQ